MAIQYTREELIERFEIPFNEEQVEAINAAVKWFSDLKDRKHMRRRFFLAGFAGTGKTTVAKIIAELCVGFDHALFVGPTGKAASRLRQKGCTGAKTLHQFIYNVRGENEDGEPIFVGKGFLEDKPKLVVLDEASMVGEYDLEKLMEHNIPVLALGDTGQVPPVKARQVFCKGTEDFLLQTIERNAGNIVRASMFVRNGKRLPLREYEDVAVRKGIVPDDVLKTFLGEDGVIICSYNTTRERMNTRARKVLGFTGALPMPGEKVVCTFNQHGYGIMNGEQGVVISFEPIPEGSEDDGEPDEMILMNYKSLTDGVQRMAKFNPLAFDKDEEVRKTAQRGAGGFDFGYALTVHKSQGSEWPRGLIIEETLRGIPYEQSMYTAITRFIVFLAIYS